jgi:DNA (cytosine-5)-methyltransferase 1
VKRFVLESPRPFIAKFQQNSIGQELERPLDTVMVAPVLARQFGKGVGGMVTEPLATVMPGGAGKTQLVAPHLIAVNHGDGWKDGRAGRREYPADAPLGTVTAARRSHAVVASTLVQTGYGERDGQLARVPGLDKPLGTLVNGQKHGLVSAFLAKHFGGVVGHELQREIGTITARDHHALAAAHLVKLRGECHSAAADEPVPTLTSGGTHIAEVCAFLLKYYGTARAGQQIDIPLHTLEAKHRFGLVTVEGTDYQIIDIGMRMLEPHELLRAQFGRFAASYDLSIAKTKTAMVRLIGNSVCPEVAEAVVRANAPIVEERVAA